MQFLPPVHFIAYAVGFGSKRKPILLPTIRCLDQRKNWCSPIGFCSLPHEKTKLSMRDLSHVR